MSYEQPPWPPRGPANPQQQPPGYGVPPGPPQRRPRARRRRVLPVLGAIAGIFILIGIIAAVTSRHTPPAGPGAAAAAAAATVTSPSPHATHSASPQAATVRTVATFTGSGIQTTRRFTVTDTWKLTWKFSCTDFGSSGNFQVFEDGGADFNGVTVNELSMGKSGSSWVYGDAGRHYLEVNSECSWTVKVLDEP
jgi:hypothetical protein